MRLRQPIAAAVLTLSSALALAGPPVSSDVIHRPVRPTAQAPTGTIGFSASHMDRSVDPRQDFYAYANGSWLKRLTIPDAESDIGGFSMLGANLDAQLQQLAVQASQGTAPKGSPAQQVGDFYRAALVGPLLLLVDIRRLVGAIESSGRNNGNRVPLPDLRNLREPHI